MNKELILFIAYEACKGNDFDLLKKNPFQYQHALRLIGINLSLHSIQLINLFSNRNLFVNGGQLRGVYFVALVVGLLLVMFLMSFLFPKRILAKAIKQYKGSNWQHRSKLIAFGYLFFNFALLILVWLWIR